MKAFVRISAENQEVELQEVSLPEMQSDEVLIKVAAFGVGIHDRYFIPSDIRFPYVIGSEGTGIIQEMGSQVKDFTIGDKIIFTRFTRTRRMLGRICGIKTIGINKVAGCFNL